MGSGVGVDAATTGVAVAVGSGVAVGVSTVGGAVAVGAGVAAGLAVDSGLAVGEGSEVQPSKATATQTTASRDFRLAFIHPISR